MWNTRFIQWMVIFLFPHCPWALSEWERLCFHNKKLQKSKWLKNNKGLFPPHSKSSTSFGDSLSHLQSVLLFMDLPFHINICFQNCWVRGRKVKSHTSNERLPPRSSTCHFHFHSNLWPCLAYKGRDDVQYFQYCEGWQPKLLVSSFISTMSLLFDTYVSTGRFTLSLIQGKNG